MLNGNTHFNPGRVIGSLAQNVYSVE